MYKTYFIKCSSFFLFISLIHIPGLSFAQKITVSGLATRQAFEYDPSYEGVRESVILDPNGEYENTGSGYFKAGGPQLEYFKDGCHLLSINYEITTRYAVGWVILARGSYKAIDPVACGSNYGAVYPFGIYDFSVAKQCFPEVPCDGWSEGATLSGDCATHPEMTPPEIIGNTSICSGWSTTLEATCEYGNPVWEANGITINPYLYTGALDQTTTYKVKCKADCKEGPELAVTVTVHSSDVQSIAHSVLPQNLDASKATTLSGTDNFKICVDANTYSLFTVKGTCLGNISAQIEPPSDISDNNPDILGSISQSLSKPNDYKSDLHLVYQHPSILPEEHPEPYSVNTLNIFKPGSDGEYEKALSRKLHIYPAPVAMVHGLWSSGEAFLIMGENLSKKSDHSSSYYPGDLLAAFDYRGSHDNSFQDNADVIPDRLTSYIETLTNKGYAVRKADIVAHSMGGLLARQYVQSPEYHDDIRKLIFINTPHSGSHLADFLLNPKWEFLAAPFNRLILPRFTDLKNSNIHNGAIRDLMVNSTQIDNVLNNPESISFPIPHHTIVTTDKFSSREDEEYTIDPKNLIYEVFDLFFENLFNDDKHDLIVTRTSQWGSLPPYSGKSDHITELEQISHTQSTTNMKVIDTIRVLLAQDPNKGAFSRKGLKPENLVYDGVSANPGETGNWLQISSLNEKKGLRGGTRQRFYVQEYNQKVRLRKLKVISVDAGKDCRAIIINAGGASSRTSNGEITFDFEIPDVVGRNDLIFLAIAETGEVAVQTTYFTVRNSFCESTRSGLWNSPQSWSCGRIPTADDPVVIRSNHVITIPQGIEGVCSQIDIELGASLKNQGGLTITNE